jgi:ribosome hibernation promoting factor
MIEKLEIVGVHMVVDEDLEKYARRKIGQLDHYTSRKVRNSLHAEVRLKESKAKDQKHCTCEVTLYLPHEVLNVTESTINMYAAIDIVETKLKIQLKKYKDKHANPKLYRRMVTRLKRRQD